MTGASPGKDVVTVVELHHLGLVEEEEQVGEARPGVVLRADK